MWTCAYCNETTDDDTWEECWKCSTPRSVSPAGAQAIKENVEQLRKRFHACLRCDTRLRYAGTREFQEGTLRGAFDFLLTKESYVTYICPRCGKVEFYIDGIGNELRGDPIGEADETDDVPEQIGSDRSDRTDRTDRSDRSDRSDRMDRSDRTDRSDRSVRSSSARLQGAGGQCSVREGCF